jgi:serine/threonine protein kinase/formylglycine-generating enzyme required for sulfatase activity/Flp pilus assembly protein TadD
MGETIEPADKSLPLDKLMSIDKICRRFEAAWQAGQQPKIDDFLADTPEPERSELRRELSAIDTEYRKPAKEEPSLKVFVERLVSSGLMTAEEVEGFIAGLPADSRPDTAKRLAREMFQRQLITMFQARAVYEGKTRGLVVGNYVVLDRLGAGGMGQVYTAQHRKMKRVVAIKQLPTAATRSPELLKRFQREMQAAAKLSHPNIVAAYDADEDNGVHFLVMEYVDGQDLTAFVKKSGPLPVAQAVDCIIQAARGLQYAHQQGVVHRDIKPSNLLLDRSGTVKILDMGLARLDNPLGIGDDGLTRSGYVMGTMDYMAPEQAIDTHAADARSDVYSLGCTLCYLLTGRAPFRADTIGKKLLAHREQPVPSLRAKRADVPEWLDAAFQRMMAKNPADRPQTMGGVVTLLTQQPLPQGPPVVAPTSLPRGSVDETLSFHKVDVDTSSQTPALDLWEGFVEPRPLPRRQRSKSFAARTLAKLSKRQRIGIGIALATAFFVVLLSVILSVRTKDGTLVVEVDDPTAVVTVDGEAVKIARKGEDGTIEIRVDPGKHRLQVQKDGMRLFTQEFTITAGRKEIVKAKLEQLEKPLPGLAPPVASPLSGPPSSQQIPRDAPSYRERGIAHVRKGNFEKGIADFTEAIRLDPKLALAYACRGEVYAEKREWDKAIADLSTAIVLDPRDVLSYGCRGETYRMKGDLDRAIADYTEAIRLDSEFALAYVGRGDVFTRKSDWNKAIADYTEAIRLDPTNSWLYGGRGDAYTQKAEWDKAIADLSEAIRLNPNERAHRNRCSRGLAYYNKGDLDSAMADYTEAIRLHPQCAKTHCNRAAQYTKQGDFDKAIADYTEAIRLCPQYPRIYFDRGAVYEKKGQKAEAEADFTQAKKLGYTKKNQGGSLPDTMSEPDESRSCRKSLLSRSRLAPIPGPQSPPPATAPFDEKKAKEHQAAWAKYLGVPVEMTNSIGMKFVLIPSGEFMMGSTAREIAECVEQNRVWNDGVFGEWLQHETPQHRVRITRPFYLGRYEVTQEQYKKIVGVNPSWFSIQGAGAAHVAGEDTSNYPVEHVSYNDAIDFCRKLSELLPQTKTIYRLPTSAEWEYACRAGTVSSWYFGNNEKDCEANGWFAANFIIGAGEYDIVKRYGYHTHPVGKKLPNPWGLFDLLGNVSEKTSDLASLDYYRVSPKDDPRGSGASDRFISRGGCWLRPALQGRSASQLHASGSSNRLWDIGFRVVCEIPPRAQVVPKTVPSDAGDPHDRDAALWVLSMGGKVIVSVGGQERGVSDASQLPKDAFRVVVVDLKDIKAVNDENLANLRSLTACRHLNLDGTGITDVGLKYLKDLDSLEQLRICYTLTTSQGLKHLRRLKSLRCLIMVGARLDDAGVEVLKEFPSLTTLEITGNSLTDASMAHLGSMKRLKGILFGYTGITNRGFEYLRDMPELEGLWIVHLRLVDGQGVVKLANLPNLKILYTENVPLDDSQLKELTRLKKLTILGLSGSKVTDSGLESLKGFPELMELGLGNTPVTDSGMASLLNLPRLGTLSLDRTQVSDKGLEVLQRIGRLKDIQLTETKVTAAGVAKLQAALPNCKITVSPEVQAELDNMKGLANAPGTDRPFVRAWHFSKVTMPWDASPAFAASDTAKLKEIVDSALRSPLVTSPEMYVDFMPQFPPDKRERVVGCAVRKIVSDKPRKVRLLTGSDDGLRLWVNGRVVQEVYLGRRATPDSESCIVDLPKGKSILVAEVYQGIPSNWGLILRIEDIEGHDLAIADDGQVVERPNRSGSAAPAAQNTSQKAPGTVQPSTALAPATKRTAKLAEWEGLKYGMFIHFGMSTFTGDPNTGAGAAHESPSTYAPSHLDVRQWVRVAKQSGMKYAVLTGKHCSGFCLWPTDVDDWSVKSGGNKTDVVGEFVKACKKEGIKPGLYYTIPDERREGKVDYELAVGESYFKIIQQHITELHTRYPGIAEQWFGGANRLSPQQRQELYELVKKLSPHCVVAGFPDFFPMDVRCLESMVPPPPRHDPFKMIDGNTYYLPLEVSDTLSKNWFWAPNDPPKSVDELKKLYSETVGRGANLLLNVPPDKTGRIPAEYVRRLQEFKRAIDAMEAAAK